MFLVGWTGPSFSKRRIDDQAGHGFDPDEVVRHGFDPCDIFRGDPGSPPLALIEYRSSQLDGALVDLRLDRALACPDLAFQFGGDLLANPLIIRFRAFRCWKSAEQCP